jgi:hypothetical protein
MCASHKPSSTGSRHRRPRPRHRAPMPAFSASPITPALGRGSSRYRPRPVPATARTRARCRRRSPTLQSATLPRDRVYFRCVSPLRHVRSTPPPTTVAGTSQLRTRLLSVTVGFKSRFRVEPPRTRRCAAEGRAVVTIAVSRDRAQSSELRPLTRVPRATGDQRTAPIAAGRRPRVARPALGSTACVLELRAGMTPVARSSTWARRSRPTAAIERRPAARRRIVRPAARDRRALVA